MPRPALAAFPSAALLLAALASAAFLSACAPMPPAGAARAAGTSSASPPGTGAAAAAGAGETIAPNANLHVQGIPPIPKSLADEVGRYTDFRGHFFVDWHPSRREMLVAHRKAGASTAQIHRLAGPLGELEQLTDFADRVVKASYEPLVGDAIVFERSSGGDEADQIYRLDLATRKVTTVSEPDLRNDVQGWLHKTSRLLYLSLPLDRTASGGRRAEITQTLTLVDPAHPQTRRKLAELPGGGWEVGGVSWDDRRLSLTRYLSAGESQVWLLDIASGERRQVLPAPGSTEKATYFAGPWKRDDSGLFVVSDRGGEFRELMFHGLADGRLSSLTRHVKGDIKGLSLSGDGRLLAALANIEGRVGLMFFDGDVFNELPSPALPDGSVGTARFHPRLPLLAYALNSSKGPSQIGTVAPADGASLAWTRPFAPPGVDTARFGDQRIVRWKSFDGREISAIATLPPARFAGRRPVLINIHGGPEAQSGFGFMNRSNYFLEELGIAVIEPNVRGSAGFGKTFLSLDDGMKREDSVKDIGALLDWIASQPNLDASRVLVTGGSYGGYMSLAVATHYADRIAGAIDVVGISNFVTFLQNTESYRRDLRRVEYGDERDPAMREFLIRISPLTNAAKITKPLFVVQGRNDPRVPYTEAEQIVARARANGTRVWYLRAENEGHGFARKENADFQFYAMVMFMRETLLK
ncbi:MAG: prolyl oligopeptidase family serine peptidase [Caldimonas sp.]